ncbi:MAG TPA: GNAT family N-acetyltransferase [Pyrinomonadaceae bacterium]|jgi:putative acetyltransferase
MEPDLYRRWERGDILNLGVQSSETEFETRMAGLGDAAAISSLLHESFLGYKSRYTSEGFAATTPTAEQVLARMSEGPIWVALLNGAIVGTVSVVLKQESLYIRGMAVLSTARGNGLGELLLTQIENYANEKGCTRLFLSTTPFLDRAIRLYERSGFRRIDEGPHDLFGTPLFTMEKRQELRR